MRPPKHHHHHLTPPNRSNVRTGRGVQPRRNDVCAFEQTFDIDATYVLILRLEYSTSFYHCNTFSVWMNLVRFLPSLHVNYTNASIWRTHLHSGFSHLSTTQMRKAFTVWQQTVLFFFRRFKRTCCTMVIVHVHVHHHSWLDL